MEKLVHRVCHYIAQRQQYNQEKEAVIAYGMLALVQMILIFIVAVVFGLLTKTLTECLIIYFTVGIFRKFTGGAHANSMAGCIFVSISTMSFMALAAHYLLSPHLSSYGMLALTFIVYAVYYYLVWKKAPVDSPNKPIKKPEKIKRLKKQSFIFLTICLLISLTLGGISLMVTQQLLFSANCALLLALGWQCATLTNPVCLLFYNDRYHYRKEGNK